MTFNFNLETLPDEMILEICRYLHGGDVLYSLFGLNMRLNQTITTYRHHISLHRTSYSQFIYIFNKILPQINSFIRTLIIFELESPSFFTTFNNRTHVFINLETLILINWTTEKLIEFIDILHGMDHLEKLVIQALDLTTETKGLTLLQKTFGANDGRLKHVVFDHECDSFIWTSSEISPVIFSNILELTIELQTSADIFQLIHLIPNIKRLQITLKGQWIDQIVPHPTLPYLNELSIYSVCWHSILDDFKAIISLASNVERLSLTLVSRDSPMVDGHQILALIPTSVKQFNYSIFYKPSTEHEYFNPANIIQSWEPIPIAYSIEESNRCIFLHTVPYASASLSLRSLFNKQLSNETKNLFYSKVDRLRVYEATNLAGTFGIIRHCRRALDFSVQMETSSKTISTNPQPTIILPRLTRLDFLSIQGTPPDLHHLKELFLAAPYLSALFIELTCLLDLLNDDDQSLLLFLLLHRQITSMSIRIKNTGVQQLTAIHLHCIARVFSRVHHLCIDMRDSNEHIESHMIPLILNHFPALIVLSIYGKLAEELRLNRNELPQWLVEQTTNDRLTNVNTFAIYYGDDRFKVWM